MNDSKRFFNSITGKQRRLLGLFINHLIIAHEQNHAFDISDFMWNYREYAQRFLSEEGE